MIPSPVGTACAYYFELKGQDVLKDVGTRCWRIDGSKCGEEILALRGRLVEEPEACQGGETDIPELQQECSSSNLMNQGECTTHIQNNFDV